MLQSVLNTDVFINGNFSSKGFKAASGSITDDSIQVSAGIDATKVIHQFPVHVSSIGTVVARTEIAHVCFAAATLVGVNVFIGTAPTSSDTVTVDVKKSTAGGAFATVLSGVVTLNSGSTNLTTYAATVTSPSLSADDALEVVITASGSSANSMVVVLYLRESPV